MENKFLTAKHWQLFILLFGIPMIFQFWAMFSMLVNFNIQATPNSAIQFNSLKYIPFILLLFIVLLFMWFWSIGISLQQIIPEKATMKIKLFKVFLCIPIFYLLLIGMLFSYTINGEFAFGKVSNLGVIAVLFFAIVLLHLFSMFCIFYCIYFVAKTIKTAELQKTVEFSDFIFEFLMIWFFPIGIWIIQPRINKIAAAIDQPDL